MFVSMVEVRGRRFDGDCVRASGHRLRAWAAGAMAAMLAACAHTSDNCAPLEVAQRAADWQLAHMQDFSYIRGAHHYTAEPKGWIQATFFIGLTHLADATHSHRYVRAIENHGRSSGWGFEQRPRHADADAIGAVWLWAARSDRSRAAPLKARFDLVLESPSSVALEFGERRPGERDFVCQERWCWSDAIFMAPPVWFELSRFTNDPRYLEHADREFWSTVETLYDSEEHLFFRDTRFISRLSPSGGKIFWSRGNGWAIAGLARMLEALPPTHPNRARYETLFRQMAARARDLQGRDGYWPASLLEPSSSPETSGTAFFVYALAWGVNAGLLPRRDYDLTIDRGWSALARVVNAEGRLGWVQQVGFAPDEVLAGDTQLYGVGALLLAAVQVDQFNREIDSGHAN